MRGLLVVFAAFAFLSGCGNGGSSDTPSVGSSDGSELLLNQVMTVGLLDRTYHLFVPGQPTNAPIVVLLHGFSEDNNGLIGLDGEPAPFRVWLDIARQENIILAVPRGFFQDGDDRGWNDCRADSGVIFTADDVGFLRELVSFIITNYPADSRRVYFNGISNGGHMAMRLAQEAPDIVAAFAAVAAADPVFSKCSPTNVPVPAMFIVGNADPILPFDGGQMEGDRGVVYSAQETIDQWVQQNGAVTVPQTAQLPNLDLLDGVVDRNFYQNLNSDADVMQLLVNGGGHSAPSITEQIDAAAILVLGLQNHDIETAEQVWNFFRDKSL